MSSCIDYSNATDSVKLPAQLQTKVVRYEELLQGVAAATNILLTGHNYYEAIDQALAALGQATQVDRTYIFETHPHPEEGKPAMSQRWEWAAPGILPEIDNLDLQNLLCENFIPHWYTELSKGRPLYGPVQEFPLIEKEILESQGILSILVVPVHIRNHFWGFIGFDQCKVKYEWTTVEVSTLQAVAGCLGGTISRHHTEQVLQGVNRSLERRVAKRTEELTAANTDLSMAIASLQETQAKLIHTEKMSSLGQLVAGIAHEINNPTNFIDGNLEHAQHYVKDILALVALYRAEYPNPTPAIEEMLEAIGFDFLEKDFTKLMNSTLSGVARITQIVRSLRNFSRLDEADCKIVNIHQSLESTLNFLQYRLQPTSQEESSEANNTKGIEVVKQFDSAVPLLECFSRELNQAIMHILTNAIDAIEAKEKQERDHWPNQIQSNRIDSSQFDSYQIKISTAVADCNHIILRITDSGIGMTPAVRAKMFDPFFTTKPVGQGTGLGLSIAHQIIVKEHKGEIICCSVSGQGTAFEIRLPVQQR